MTAPQLSPNARTDARLWLLMQRPTPREYVPNEPTPCHPDHADPEIWHNYRRPHKAIAVCKTCPFIGRCGWNAVAAGATHGVWAGVQLPGDHPTKLAGVYQQLLTQFNQRRSIELGHAPVRQLDIAETITRRPVDDDELGIAS